MPAARPEPRIATLDFIRGIAVMGILLANLPAFGLPEAAYFSPMAWGGHDGADVVAWFATFVLIEGKMRGLFSLLFGASMLLVIDRAKAAGQSPARVHFTRMAALFAIGCVHLYLIWWGDILTHYALIGAFAYLFVKLPARMLLALSIALVLYDILTGMGGAVAGFASAARNTPASIEVSNAFASSFGTPPRSDLLAEIAAFRGSFADAVAWRWTLASAPQTFALLLGPQTLSAMVLGMAAYRSGFLVGGWSRRAYRITAIACLVPSFVAEIALALNSYARGFDQNWIYFASIVGSAPFRLPMTIGYAALCALAFRSGGRVSGRIAAVGRAAFTNYLGTSIVMLLIFTGFGRFGMLSRAELYGLAPIVWVAMLAWSQPWLRRYRYGPLEWGWRSLSRWSLQPMRRNCESSAKELAS